jgi:group II intron reverse transcriptase/maturase
MRTAETILTVIRERGRKRLPLERVYRLLFNRDLYLRAYAKLYPNKGALTPGATTETVDGMAVATIDRIIAAIRSERYRWTPVRRTYIPKANGKRRPLGLPTWSDKLLQEVLRSILDAYFDPQFSECSHGFRARRGCHTALLAIRHQWKGVRWFIEGDIAQYFDTINHDKLIAILRETITDERFLRLIRGLLEAGYLEDWNYQRTLSGAPQGGVLSPLLSNIYLDRFDQWVETTLIPAHTRGEQRQDNPVHARLCKLLYYHRKRGNMQRAKEIVKQRRRLPAGDPNDPGYRRLRYVRYADDFLLGVIGSRADAEQIKRQIKDWLSNELSLTLSDEKTLITHATTQAARFLGYDILSQHADDKIDANGARSVNRVLALRVPQRVIQAKCKRYRRGTVVMHRPELLTESDYTIVTLYQQEYRGIVQYYQLAHNIRQLNQLHWVMQTSLLKTLAAKHRSTVTKQACRLRSTVQTETGKTVRCLEVCVPREGKPPLVARFGGISLTRQTYAMLDDRPFVDKGGRTELLQRLLAQECELCGSREQVEVHHIRKLAPIYKKRRTKRTTWEQRMAERHRKTLVVCRRCHKDIHAGRPTRQRPTE